MKALARNKQTFWYALATGELTEVQDENKLYTGELEPTYGEPTEAHMNLSPASGRAALEWFGINDSYSRVLVTDDMSCPFTETTRLWLNRTPNEGPHDNIVVRVAKSLNTIMFAVQGVETDPGEVNA